MGLSHSGATALILVSVLIALNLCMGSLLPVFSEVQESYESLTRKLYEEIQTTISITGIVDGVDTWWNTSFAYRKRITINHSQVAGQLSNFPVLVNVSSTDLRDKVLQPNGNDIAFVDSTHTHKLNHEIEQYISATGHLIAWVNVTTVYSNSDTQFYLYYGNATCESQQNPAGVWDSNYVMVHHLNETAGIHYDSTNYGNNGSIVGGVIQDASGLSQLDGCAEFHGQDAYINFGNSTSLTPASLTLEAWVKDPPLLLENHATGGAMERVISDTSWYPADGEKLVDTGSINAFDSFEFWSYFLDQAQWVLEYNNSGVWIQCPDVLTVNYTVLQDNTRKFSLDYVAPYTAQYRLSLAIDLATIHWGYDTWNKTFSFTYDLGEPVQLLFNYSDIAFNASLLFSHGFDENKFWFVITHTDMIPAGTLVSLDPEYTVSTGATTDSTAYNTGRKLVRTTDGILHCVYHAIPPGNTKYNIYYAKSTNQGASWTTMFLTNDSNTDQKYPSIAVDGGDNIYIVWQGESGALRNLRIRYCIYTHASSSWGQPSNITDGSRNQYYPSLAVDSTNKVHVVWEGFHSGSTANTQIRYVNYSGGNWGTIVNITTQTTLTQYRPSVAVDSTDTVHVVWYGHIQLLAEQTSIRYSKLTTSWSAPINITSETTHSQLNPCIAIDSNDIIHVVWQGLHAGSTSFTQIRYSKYTTSWSAPVNISSNTVGHQTSPSISVDGNNYLHVVWHGRIANIDPVIYIQYSGYIDSWDAPTHLTTGTSSYYANLIWAYYPDTIDVCWPYTGYAFVFMKNTVVTYYASSDLSWKNKQVLSMSQSTYSLEISSSGTTLYGYIGNQRIQTSIDTNWRYVVLTFDNSEIKLYKDGQGLSSVFVPELIYPEVIPNVTAGRYLTGWLDELRISKISRSPSWINASYLNQYAPAAFLYFGTEQNVDQNVLNITVTNIGKTTLVTRDFSIIINGTLISCNATQIYLAPQQIVYFISTEAVASGEKRIKLITDNGIADYYYHPG